MWLSSFVTLPRWILFFWQKLQNGSVTRKDRIFITARLWLRLRGAGIFVATRCAGSADRAC